MRSHSAILCALAVAALATATGTSSATAQPRPRPARPAKLDLAKASVDVGGADLAAAVAAATALGSSREPAHHEPVLDALASGVHPDVATAALTALAATATKADLPTIAIYTRFRNPTVRAAALRAYAQNAGDTALIMTGLASYDAPVRGAAADAVAAMRHLPAIPALLVLLDKGELPAARALGLLGDDGLFRTVAEHFGVAPDAALAVALGGMLVRPAFEPENARVELVRMLSKLSGVEALDALEAYVKVAPANPPRQSRREAEAVLTARQAGDR